MKETFQKKILDFMTTSHRFKHKRKVEVQDYVQILDQMTKMIVSLTDIDHILDHLGYYNRTPETG